MITHTQKVVGSLDQKIDGYEITCSLCPLTSFMPSVKHLPSREITKKFQAKLWAVNGGNHAVCPNCIEKRRSHKQRRTRQPGAPSVVIAPQYEILALCPRALSSVVRQCGFSIKDVTELEAPVSGQTSFKLTFDDTKRLPLHRLNHAESEIVSRFDVQVLASDIKQEIAHVNGGLSVNVTAQLHWVINLQPVFHEPVHEGLPAQ